MASISGSTEMIRENMFENSSSLRLRYIVEFYDELKTNLDALEDMQKTLQKQNNNLTYQSWMVSEISGELEYFISNSDTKINFIYQNEIAVLKTKLAETDSILSKRLMQIVKLDESINAVAFRLEEISNFAQNLIKEKENSLTHPNYPPIWKTTPSDFKLTLIQSIQQTSSKSLESLAFFLSHGNVFQVLFRLLLLMLSLVVLYNFYKKNREEFISSKTVKYLHKYPFHSSLILGMTIIPLFVDHAPYVLLELVFVLLTLVLSALALKKYDFLYNKYFFIVLGYYVLLKFFNLLVVPTYPGRIVAAFSVLLIVPIIINFRLYLSKYKEKKKEANVVFVLFISQMVIGWFLTIIGFFMLGRAYFISALDTVVLAFSLYVSVYTIIDYLRVLTKIINKRLKLFYINREVVDKYIGNLIKGFAMIYLFISILKYINVYDFIASSIADWFNEPRLLGGNSFTYNSIFLFVSYSAGAIILANFFNKLIDTNDNNNHIKRRTSLGGFMLLFRFLLISTGFILAFIASGIPVTQLSILMGAVGVGIGFGLQSIFNNIVSGLIIAIEKPISVGDMIEVGTNSGWVREIGIRASNIQSFDGAEIIVPNGEIVSNKITNWTHSDKKRRMEILIGVAYKSDPHQVYTLFINILSEHPEILKTPEPFIVFTGMGDSSLDFRICFWIADFIEGVRIKSEVLLQIFDVLKANNIEIPFPQRDLHLRSVDEEVIKKIAVNDGK
jgi:small-conductance mechanosensitive channel